MEQAPKRFDFLVVGGGIAGLSYALEVAKAGSVAVLFKKGLTESSTARAQGGIAAVKGADDNIDLHVEDTLRAGAGLCHKKIVEIVVSEGPARVEELIKLGAHFDKADETNYHLHQEGGHSRRRVFHSADATGFEIQQSLIRAAKNEKRITFFEHCHAVDLITTAKLGLTKNGKGKVLGAYVLTAPGVVEPFLADKVLIATGGAGKVYLYTSNPDVATGDGIAMCYRAGASVANLEFFQFHPTCLFHPKAKSFLITEAMRGEGARLRRIDGEYFMKRHHPDAELAPRDVVARAIDFEMKAHGHEYVLLDISHRPPDFVKEHFPTIFERCLGFGFDITKEPLPVVPAAHYGCGGIVTDEHGKSEIDDLYVAGECAHTGLHGANRLGSNSLLEGVVFGHRAAVHSIENFKRRTEHYEVPAWDPGSAVDMDEQVVIEQTWDEIRRFMWNYVGIVRSDKRLQRALKRCERIREEINEYYWNFIITPDLVELRNLAIVAELVVRCAIARKESRGLHYNINYQMSDVKFEHDTILEGAL